MCTCFMALRVLLADESSTIKKVMQLALQDFAVEVKAVPVGVDVLSVAKNFNPDIVFADVLLAKMTGYEVSKAIKTDAALNHTPVVLMWSSFMELDEAKARDSRAEGRLEKPFDAEALRSLVKQLVPQTQDNAISSFLTFPDLPNIIESEAPKSSEAPAVATSVLPEVPSVDADPTFLMDMEEPEEFQAVPLPKAPEAAKKSPAKTPATPAKDDWSHQDLSKYKIDLFATEMNDNINYDDQADLTRTSITLSSGAGEIALEDIGEEAFQAPLAPAAKKKSAGMNLPSSQSVGSAKTGLGMTIDAQHAEDILRQEARKVLEAIAWKMIPDVVERVVREELQKLLKDAERL